MATSGGRPVRRADARRSPRRGRSPFGFESDKATPDPSPSTPEMNIPLRAAIWQHMFCDNPRDVGMQPEFLAAVGSEADSGHGVKFQVLAIDSWLAREYVKMNCGWPAHRQQR